ncbi:membrane protein [Marinobacter salarius]|uniref:Membrane protein n=1 Tax=Marinobacter salarius TaxID=1420917 RepID=A0A1W6K6U9_9GAMM|nr:membrane protein [Marinobacter salarius]
MDPSVLMQPLLQLWFLITLVLVVSILLSPWFIGHPRKFNANACARLFLDKNRYHLIKYVTRLSEDDTIQIDQRIVSPRGLPAFGISDMNGGAYGNVGQRDRLSSVKFLRC